MQGGIRMRGTMVGTKNLKTRADLYVPLFKDNSMIEYDIQANKCDAVFDIWLQKRNIPV